MHQDSVISTTKTRRMAAPTRSGAGKGIKGIAMPTVKTTTIQARITTKEKKFLRDYAESQGITLSELLRRSTTALIEIIKANQANRQQ